MTNLTFDDIREKIKNNPFNRSHYSTSIPLATAIHSVMYYTHTNLDRHDLDYVKSLPISSLFEAIPAFQRDNDKWTESMQISFVENIIMGYASDLMLYTVGDTAMTECKILDGLQRLTAIYRFLAGEIMAFGKSFLELKEQKIINAMTGRLTLRVYTFNSEQEAVAFYIAMNENITHSTSDIEKAKKYLESLND